MLDIKTEKKIRTRLGNAYSLLSEAICIAELDSNTPTELVQLLKTSMNNLEGISDYLLKERVK